MKKIYKELQSHRINLCITDTEFKLLEQIRYNHNKSISQLVRDAIKFYSVYYPTPETTTID